MSLQRINYSIIIPHKNSPDLLDRCLASIPDRGDVQIIVVDDNSDDDKKPVADAHQAELILLDAAHSKGAGRARNVGLSRAKGKWLLFADADDKYTDGLSALMDKYAEDADTDIVYLNVDYFNENGEIWAHEINSMIKAYLKGKSHAEKRLRYGIWTPWSRMIKRELVEKNQLRFDELLTCNDKMFCLKCSKCAQNMAVEPAVIYHYYRRVGGSLTDKYRTSLVLDPLLDICGKTISLYQEVGFPQIPSFLNYFVRSRYSAGLPLKVKLKKYRLALKSHHVSLLTDVMRFIKNKVSVHWEVLTHSHNRKD